MNYVTREKEFDFNDYIALYESGKSIHSLKPMKNPTYKVLSKAKNVDIRVVDRDKSYKFLSKCSKLEKFTIDTKKESHRYFYIIPVQTPNGQYAGFIYRTVLGKAYNSVYRQFKDFTKKVPIMYGFYRDFDNYDRHTSCMPILVCESAKDAMFLKHIYPYTVAANTASLGASTHVLANITDKIILAYDNDETGRENTPRDRNALTKLGCSVDVLKYHDGFKDASDYVDHPQELESLKEQLKLRVKGLLTGCTLVY
jgi:DNA primase